VAGANLNNKLCSVLHAVCLVPVSTLCVMLSLMLCCPARALGYTEAMSKEVEALHNLHGLNDKEAFLDHIEASKVWTYFTSAIVSSHCDGEVKLRRFSSRPT